MVKGLGSLLVLAVGTFLLGMAEFVMEGILPDLAADLRISIPQAGHAISIYALGVCVGATFLIALHKLRPKHILLGLLALVFTGALLSVTAQNFLWLMVARFISGLPHGAYYGVAIHHSLSAGRREPQDAGGVGHVRRHDLRQFAG